MSTFKTLAIQDQMRFNQWVSLLPWAHVYTSSEYVFENLFAWSSDECIHIRWFDHFGIIKCQKRKQTWYFPPVVKHVDDFKDAILWIFRHDPDARLIGLTDDMLPYVPDIGVVFYDDRLSEYIYDAKSFIEQKGSKYHRKRNLVSQFIKKYSYDLKPYQPSDREEVMKFIHGYHEQGGSIDDLEPLMKAIDHSNQFSYLVDLLWVENKVIGLSVGLVSLFNHGVVLFEKADTHYIGSYAFLATAFAERHFKSVKFITRQEDLGIPEIKHSKLSYLPIKKDRKYAIEIQPKKIEKYHLYLENFKEDSKDYVDHFFLNHYDEKRSYDFPVDGHVVSALHLVPKTLSLYGQSFPIEMIVAAATEKDYRKQGHMKFVIQKTLCSLYDSGIPFVTLYPVQTNYYISSGFITYAYESLITEWTESVECRLEHTSSTTKLLNIYKSFVEQYDGYMVRDIQTYRELLDALSQDHYISSLIYDHDHVLGYLIHHESSVEEIVLLSQVRPIIPNLSLEHVKIPSTFGQPAQMARMVNLKSFLHQYRPHDQINADITFRVSDPIIKENNLCLRIIASAGHLTIEDCIHSDYHLSIEELTKIMICGTNDPRMQGLFPIREIITFDKY